MWIIAVFRMSPLSVYSSYNVINIPTKYQKNSGSIFLEKNLNYRETTYRMYFILHTSIRFSRKKNAPKKSCFGKFLGVLGTKSISKYVVLWKSSFDAQYFLQENIFFCFRKSTNAFKLILNEIQKMPGQFRQLLNK